MLNGEFETTAANVNVGNVLITAKYGETKVLSANFVGSADPSTARMFFKLEGVKGVKVFAAYGLVSVKRGT